MTPDGFAIVNLTVKINGQPFSTDDRRRYITPEQQLSIARCFLPWLMVPVLGLLMIVFQGTGRHHVSTSSPTDMLLLAAFLATWCSCAYSFWKAYQLLQDINLQIYDEEGS